MLVRVWFDGVPVVEVGPLLDEIFARGWECRQSLPGEWWCEFSRSFESREEFDDELDELKALFHGRWTQLGTRVEPKLDLLAG